jgi:uncharacterized protein (TIGR02271 family)
MSTTTLTALYDMRPEADRAAARLVGEAGVARSDVEVIAQETSASASGADAETGFVASLKNLFVPDDDRASYSEAVRRGGFLLTAKVEQTAAERAMNILEEHGAVDLDERQRAWRAEGWTGHQGTSAAQALPDGSTVAIASTTAGAAAPAMTATATSREAPLPLAGTTGGEERIEIVEEQMRIGKRLAAGGRVRVRSYVVETPVEEQVTLRDEHVSVERRTVDRAPTPADEALFAERTIEATETDEEAVVSKTAHVTGEVVVSKTAEERVETVRDTVRRTEVEVEDARTTAGVMAAEPAAGPPTGAPRTSGPRR